MNTEAYLSIDRARVMLGGRAVVEDVSIKTPRGHMVVLVGPNGAGKTTLLRALVGLVPMTGVVRLDGGSVTALSTNARARSFAYLPQGHLVHWPLPVRTVVALGRYPHGSVDPANLSVRDTEVIDRAMEATGVTDLAERRVTELSGGECGRVLLARVLAVEAPVILVDEPTASLDPRHQIVIMRLLQTATRQGAVVVVVTHDLGLAARFADWIVVLKDGRVAAQGRPDEALTSEILADVFRVGVFRGERDGQPVLVPWATV
jgi:iron complex transport system ATP-binding protein